MQLGKLAIVALACSAITTTAEARPRLFKILGAVAAAPVAIIAGAAGARAYPRQARAPRQQAIAEPRSERRGIVTSWGGPVFWPYASDDLFDYVFGQRSAADRFWAHGYGDALDAMFITAPLYPPRGRGPRVAMQGTDNSSAMPSWAGLCGSQSPNPAEATIERVRALVQPKPEQTKALEDLQPALSRAYERIQSACPAEAVVDATARMDLMAARLLAMRQATTLVHTPLKNLYAALDEDQKARLNAGDVAVPVSNGTGSTPPPGGTLGCAEAASDMDWPDARLQRRVRLQGEQMKSFEILRGTFGAFEKFVASSCIADKAQTAPERLEAAQKRLNVLRYAVRHVSPALDQFYASLIPPQRARFSSLGR